MDSLGNGSPEFRFVFNEETLRDALTVTAVAAVTGTIRFQKGMRPRSIGALLKGAAKSIEAEGRTERTEAR